MVSAGPHAYMMADKNPRSIANSQYGIRPFILLAARQKARRRSIIVDIEHYHIGITIGKMEIRLSTGIFDRIFRWAIMAELVEIIVERGPSVCCRYSCLMISYRRHDRHLTQERRPRREEILIPPAVRSIVADKITVHETDIGIECADGVLHIRPIIAGIAVDIGDRENPVRCSLLRSSLGATCIRIATEAVADREIIARERLQIRQCDNMHIPFARHIPSIRGSDTHAEAVTARAVIHRCLCGFHLLRHLP